MSMVQVISHSGRGGGLAADRTPFYGIKLPSEVKKLVQLAKTVEHATVRKVLKCKSVYFGNITNFNIAKNRTFSRVCGVNRK